jgi:hypothetical protein
LGKISKEISGVFNATPTRRILPIQQQKTEPGLKGLSLFALAETWRGFLTLDMARNPGTG